MGRQGASRSPGNRRATRIVERRPWGVRYAWSMVKSSRVGTPVSGGFRSGMICTRKSPRRAALSTAGVEPDAKLAVGPRAGCNELGGDETKTGFAAWRAGREDANHADPQQLRGGLQSEHQVDALRLELAERQAAFAIAPATLGEACAEDLQGVLRGPRSGECNRVGAIAGVVRDRQDAGARARR